jgi:hypothetical protein
LLLNEQQKETHTGAQTDVAFFVNFVVLLLAADVALAVDLVLNTSREAYKFALLLVPVGLAWALYRAAVEAAVRWGQVVRATFDLYRLPLYRGLGVKVPTGPAEEQVIAEFVNRCLWYGEPIPEAARSSSEGGKE